MSNSFNIKNSGAVVIMRLDSALPAMDGTEFSMSAAQAEHLAKGLLAAAWRARGNWAPEGAKIGTIEMAGEVPVKPAGQA